MNKVKWLFLVLALPAGAAIAQSDDQAADEEVIEEVVVVGYTTQEKADITGAVTSVELDSVADMPAGNIMRNLQGRVPGLTILTSGNPNQNSVVRIRGTGLGSLGFNDPLYVIDGVPTNAPMQELNSSDIESMQVLKDAAAASIYGARAGNGVIIVTTKKGSRDGLEFDVRMNQSIEQFDYDNINPLSSTQRAQVLFQASINDRTNPNSASPLYTYDWNGDFDNPVLNSIQLGDANGFIDAAQTMQAANTNWFDAVTQDSTITDFGVSMSNGNDDGRVFASFGWFNADGIVDQSNFERLSFRINSDYQFMDGSLRVGQHAAVTEQTANLINDLAVGILNLGIEQQSIVPIRTVDGEGWGGPTGGITDRDNPVRVITENNDNESRFNRVLGDVYVEWDPKWVDGLTLTSRLGINRGEFNFRNFQKASQAGSINFADALRQTSSWNETIVWSNTAAYDFEFRDRHFLNVLVGSESVDFESEEFQASASGFALQDRDFAFLDQGTTDQRVTGSGDEWALLSYFSKIDYDYDGRYLASLTYRRDGSSRFGRNNRWGNFPAASAGWRMTEERFWNIDFINDMKLRVSWGETGNQEISSTAALGIFAPRFATRSVFTTEQDEGTAYDIAGTGTLQSGFARIQTENPDLKWETSTQTNVGLDFEVWDNRIFGTIDWYKKRTEDVLTTTSPLATQGEGAQMVVNGGTIDNSGIELSLGYEGEWQFREWAPFEVRITGNVAKTKNEVVDLPANVVNSFGGDGQNNTILGQSINSVFGFVADGLFQSQAEVDAHATQTGAGPGRVRFLDVNNDGVIDSADQAFFATFDPDLTYGLNFDVRWKNWDFNMFWQGVSGGDIRNGWRIFTDFASVNAGSNYGDRTLNAWTPDNPTNVPALTLIDNNNEARQSSFLWEDGSYLKLRNISAGYTFDESFLSKVGLYNMRVYLRIENLLTFTEKGVLTQDPETPNADFPVPTRYTLGFNASF